MGGNGNLGSTLGTTAAGVAIQGFVLQPLANYGGIRTNITGIHMGNGNTLNMSAYPSYRPSLLDRAGSWLGFGGSTPPAYGNGYGAPGYGATPVGYGGGYRGNPYQQRQVTLDGSQAPVTNLITLADQIAREAANDPASAQRHAQQFSELAGRLASQDGMIHGPVGTYRTLDGRVVNPPLGRPDAVAAQLMRDLGGSPQAAQILSQAMGGQAIGQGAGRGTAQFTPGPAQPASPPVTDSRGIPPIAGQSGVTPPPQGRGAPAQAPAVTGNASADETAARAAMASIAALGQLENRPAELRQRAQEIVTQLRAAAGPDGLLNLRQTTIEIHPGVTIAQRDYSPQDLVHTITRDMATSSVRDRALDTALQAGGAEQGAPARQGGSRGHGGQGAAPAGTGGHGGRGQGGAGGARPSGTEVPAPTGSGAVRSTSADPQVQVVQQQLQAIGLNTQGERYERARATNPNAPMDGIPGPQTQAAVRTAQAAIRALHPNTDVGAEGEINPALVAALRQHATQLAGAEGQQAITTARASSNPPREVATDNRPTAPTGEQLDTVVAALRPAPGAPATTATAAVAPAATTPGTPAPTQTAAVTGAPAATTAAPTPRAAPGATASTPAVPPVNPEPRVASTQTTARTGAAAPAPSAPPQPTVTWAAVDQHNPRQQAAVDEVTGLVQRQFPQAQQITMRTSPAELAARVAALPREAEAVVSMTVDNRQVDLRIPALGREVARRQEGNDFASQAMAQVSQFDRLLAQRPTRDAQPRADAGTGAPAPEQQAQAPAKSNDLASLVSGAGVTLQNFSPAGAEGEPVGARINVGANAPGNRQNVRH